jgi:hypothetical protein
VNADKTSFEESRAFEWLSEHIGLITRPVDAPLLWERIEADLGQHRRLSRFAGNGLPRTIRVLGIAGLAAALFACCFLLFFRAEQSNSAHSLIVKVGESRTWKSECKRIEGELARLEPLICKDKPPCDETGFLLQQLALLDNSIRTCIKVWESNRMNRAVQQSLLYCYGKKLDLVNHLLDR